MYVSVPLSAPAGGVQNVGRILKLTRWVRGANPSTLQTVICAENVTVTLRILAPIESILVLVSDILDILCCTTSPALIVFYGDPTFLRILKYIR